MVEQLTTSAHSYLHAGVVRTRLKPRGPAKLAQTVAQKRPKRRRRLSAAPGWHKDGYGSRTQFNWRNMFLAAAGRASSQLLTEYQALAPLVAAVQPVFGGHVHWTRVDEYAQVIRLAGRHPNLEAPQQAALMALHEAVIAWQAKFFLVATQERAPDARVNFAWDWVARAACANLQLPGTPLNAGVTIYSSPLPQAGQAFEVEVSGWDGSESAADWYQRAKARVSAALKEHVADVEAELKARGFEPLPVAKQAGLEYLELAARWQVLEQPWIDFLEAERDANGEERDPRLLRRSVLSALSAIGIVPRPGMSSNPGTATEPMQRI